MVAKFPFDIIDNGVTYAFWIRFRGREKLNTQSTLANNIRQPGLIILYLLFSTMVIRMKRKICVG